MTDQILHVPFKSLKRSPIIHEVGKPRNGALVTRWIVGATTVTTLGCQTALPSDPNGVPASIEVNPARVVLPALGATHQFRAIAKDADGNAIAGKTIVWSSTDDRVATVSDGGIATAVMNGSASITAATDRVSGTASVEVAQRSASVAVLSPKDTLTAFGDTARLTTLVKDANDHPMGSHATNWASSDTAVVAVNGEGLATAVGTGLATITAMVDSVSGQFSLTVAQEIAAVVVTPSADTLTALGDTTRLAMLAKDANDHPASSQAPEWISSDTGVVTVDREGLVTAVGVGGAIVTAIVDSVSGVAPVTVAQVMTSIEVTSGTNTLTALGDTVHFTAQGVDTRGHHVANAQYLWSSSDHGVAMVDSSGVVEAVGVGEATITANAGGISGTAPVVVAQRGGTVTVTSARDTLVAIGDTSRLAVTVTDANGHAIEMHLIEWTSSNSAVVSVDGEGLVTAVAGGAATVTATVDGASGTTTMHVAQALTSIEVSGGKDSLTALTATTRFLAQGLDSGGSAIPGVALSWTSSDSAVARVDSSGLVEAVGNGQTTITVSPTAPPPSQPLRGGGDLAVGATDPAALAATDLTSSVVLTVAQITASVDVTPAVAAIFPVGHTLQLDATVLDALGHPVAGATVAWTSSDDAIAHVDTDGLVTGAMVGAATIDANSGGVQGVATVEVLSTFGCVSQRQIPVEQCDALVGIYDATAGDAWINNDGWLADLTPCTWYGITCLGPVPHLTKVLAVELQANGLTGSVPPQLIDLLDLILVNLGGNALTGPVLPEFANLPNLQVLVLGGNQLTGQIPHEIGGMGDLLFLSLAFNALTGVIPPELGNMTNLEVISLSGNQLTGSIPTTLGNLSNLSVLEIADNPLGGTIPPELGSLSRLRSLLLAGASLTGAIPPQLGSLSSLQVLNLERNSLNGAIPPQLGNLTNLLSLYLNENSLTGPIPAELGNLGSLETLDLSANPLTGTIPTHLGNLSSLRVLRAKQGGLSGGLPAVLGSLLNLEIVDLSSNALTGEIPSEFGNLTNLQSLFLQGNQLNGTIPSELGNLTRLEQVRLESNLLSGEVPLAVARIGAMALICDMTGGNTLSIPDTAEYRNLTDPPGQPICGLVPGA